MNKKHEKIGDSCIEKKYGKTERPREKIERWMRNTKRRLDKNYIIPESMELKSISDVLK